MPGMAMPGAGKTAAGVRIANGTPKVSLGVDSFGVVFHRSFQPLFLGVDSSSMMFNHRSFQTYQLFPRVLGG